MRIAIVGLGAVGGTFAAALHRAGRPFVCVSRTRPSEVRLSHAIGDVRFAPRWLRSPEDASPVALVLLATKAHQTPAVEPWLRVLVPPDGVVAVLQNGIEHHERLAPFVPGGAYIVPTVVDCPAHREAPGHIVARGRVRLRLPHTPGVDRVLEAFAGTFADVSVVPDFAAEAWTKLLLNAASGGIGLLTRSGPDALRDPAHAARFLALAAEILAVARAEGVELPAALPQHMLAGLQASGSSQPSSIVADRLAGRPTEWRERNEVIVRLAARHGIAVPENERLVSEIRAGEPAAR